MVNYPLFPPQKENIVGLSRNWWHLRQACAGNGVLIDSNDPNGMKVTRASASSVNVAAGHYANKGIWKAYAGASPAIESIPAASEGYHRYDSICVKLSDNTIVRVAGTEAVPDDVDDFLENFTPLPADLNSTDYFELAIICVDEDGIRSTDNGSYSVGGVCDTRPPFVFGLDDSTLKISADGKLEVQSLYPLLSVLTTRGDMVRRSDTTWERFAAGAQYTVLAMGASDPAWSTVASLLNTILTTQGDLLYRSSGDSARLAKGNQHAVLSQGANDPAWLDVGEQTVVGRITSGNLAALTVAQLQALVLGAALPENTAIILDPALSADGKYSGIVETGTAGATLAFGDVIYQAVADDRWELAKADAVATSIHRLGICVQAASGDGEATTVLLHGKVRADTAFPTFTKYAPVYIDASTAGDLTSTKPTAGIVRAAGHAISGDELFFSPDIRWKAVGSSTGTGSTQTIAHLCGAAPTMMSIVPTETGIDEISGLHADATNFYVTVTSGIDYNWSAEL